MVVSQRLTPRCFIQFLSGCSSFPTIWSLLHPPHECLLAPYVRFYHSIRELALHATILSYHILQIFFITFVCGTNEITQSLLCCAFHVPIRSISLKFSASLSGITLLTILVSNSGINTLYSIQPSIQSLYIHPQSILSASFGLLTKTKIPDVQRFPWI